MIFGPQRGLTLTGLTTGEYAVCASGATVWVAWMNGTSVQVIKSTNYGLTFGAAVTVDTNAANFAVVLNDPFVCDPVTGKLYLVWERNEGQAGSPPSLYVSTSTDNGATWAAPITLDNGTTNHANNRFLRVGLVAYNGVAAVWYTCISSSTFTTDGMWYVGSTDGGATWSSPSSKYSLASQEVGEINAVLGEDGSAHVSTYLPGVLANLGGDIYYLHGTWAASGYTWSASPVRVTTGQTCGRARLSASAGTVLIVTSTNFGGASADIAVIRSTDNGATWGSVTTLATHTTGALDHPDIGMYGDTAVALWIDQGTSSYLTSKSTDGGATWSLFVNPFTSGASSDAPKLRIVADVLIAYGSGVKYSYYPIGCPDPASTATTILDAFTRADENPLSGGATWSTETVGGASAGAKLVSNQVTRQGPAGTFNRSGSYLNNATIAGSYEAFCDIATATNGEVDLLLAAETAPKNGYRVRHSGGDFGVVTGVDRADAGAFTTLGSDDTTIGLASGTKLLLRLTPTYVAGYYHNGTAWQEMSRGPDAAVYRAGLNWGFNIAGQTDAGPVIDNAGGNALAAPSNSVAPVIAGTVGGVLSVSNRGTWATASGATPASYGYQWQSSPHGTNTWSSLTRAVLPTYDSSADATKDYRCVVTGINSLGSTTATSNIAQPSGPASAHVYFRAKPKGGSRRIRA